MANWILGSRGDNDPLASATSTMIQLICEDSVNGVDWVDVSRQCG